MSTKCILCSCVINPKLGYYKIGDTIIENSNKTIKSILAHLSKCIKLNYDFQDYSQVCFSCYEKLTEYDRLMIELLKRQKELSNTLKCSLKLFDKLKNNEEADDENVSFENNNQNVIEVNDLTGSNSNISSTNEIEEIENGDNTNDSHSYKPSKKVSLRRDPSTTHDCGVCEKTFLKKKELKAHLDTHTTEVKCQICGVLRKDEEYLELHMNVHEGKTENDCRYCDKQYSRRANVIRHMQKHWDKKKFQCEKCGLRFSQTYLLYNHKMVHEAEEEPLVCAICEQKFRSKKTYKHHMVTHQEDRPMHTCEICGKKFTERYTLKMHQKNHLVNTEELTKKESTSRSSKKFTCIICDEVFGTMELLDSHKAKEHDVICDESVFADFFS